MPESAVGHVIERLNESHEGGRNQPSRMELIEIVEAVLLALVALATAWSGYQAARWNGNRAELYNQADQLKVDAESLMTLAGQEL